MRYFVKYGYSGPYFTGFQRGNGERSVEDSIEHALVKLDITGGITSAARTDRGVSAAGNVFAFDCGTDIREVLSELNSSVEGMIFHAYSSVGEDASPRHNESKTYRYIVFGLDPATLEKLLEPFTGRHDYSNFARVDHRNPVRTIERIDVTPHEMYTAVDFHGKSFIWQQIRRIMGFVFHEIETSGRIDPFSDHHVVRLAPAENLVLMDITYAGISFLNFRSRTMARGQEKKVKSALMNYIYSENIMGILNGSIYSVNE